MPFYRHLFKNSRSFVYEKKKVDLRATIALPRRPRGLVQWRPLPSVTGFAVLLKCFSQASGDRCADRFHTLPYLLLLLLIVCTSEHICAEASPRLSKKKKKETLLHRVDTGEFNKTKIKGNKKKKESYGLLFVLFILGCLLLLHG